MKILQYQYFSVLAIQQNKIGNNKRYYSLKSNDNLNTSNSHESIFKS